MAVCHVSRRRSRGDRGRRRRLPRSRRSGCLLGRGRRSRLRYASSVLGLAAWTRCRGAASALGARGDHGRGGRRAYASERLHGAPRRRAPEVLREPGERVEGRGHDAACVGAGRVRRRVEGEVRFRLRQRRAAGGDEHGSAAGRARHGVRLSASMSRASSEQNEPSAQRPNPSLRGFHAIHPAFPRCIQGWSLCFGQNDTDAPMDQQRADRPGSYGPGGVRFGQALEEPVGPGYGGVVRVGAGWAGAVWVDGGLEGCGTMIGGEQRIRPVPQHVQRGAPQHAVMPSAMSASQRRRVRGFGASTCIILGLRGPVRGDNAWSRHRRRDPWYCRSGRE